MKRRTFIKGAIAAAVSAALPGAANPYLSANEWQPMGYTYQTFKVADPAGTRYAAALARSMAQTKERVAANVFSTVFDWKLYPEDSSEGARRSVGVEGSPDRI